MSSTGPSSNGDEELSPIVEINVTPLVDIMLVLLIIFMVTATLITNPAIQVDLPQGGSQGKSTTKSPDISVTITRTGEIQYRNQMLKAPALLDELRKEYREHPNSRLIIVADQKAYHGSVVQVMNIAKTVGFKNIGVAIDPNAAQ